MSAHQPRLKPDSSDAKQQITELQGELDRLRRSLSISDRGQVLYLADANACGDELVVVEADGLGGATLKVIQGNYPVDYLTKLEKSFSAELAAEKAAETISR